MIMAKITTLVEETLEEEEILEEETGECIDL
jgi:hypothetical protein